MSDFDNKIFISWSWENNRLDRNRILGYDPDNMRRASQALERANISIKSWVEAGLGTVINFGGMEGTAAIPVDLLQDLPKIKTSAETVTGFLVTIGIATDLKQSLQALEVAKREKVGQLLTWSKEIGDLYKEIKDLSKNANDSIPLIPHASGTIVGWNHKGDVAKPLSESKIGPIEPSRDQSDHQLTPTMAAPIVKPEKVNKDLVRILHQHAIKFNKPQTVTHDPEELEQIKAKISKMLMKIKESTPNLDQLRETNPELYDMYIVLAKALVDLLRQVAKKKGLQKSDQDLYHEFEPLVKVRFKLGTGLSNLPIGTIFDSRMKILDKKTGKPKWRQLMSGMIRGKLGGVVSSLNPDEE